jgi:hypothetical protein
MWFEQARPALGDLLVFVGAMMKVRGFNQQREV